MDMAKAGEWAFIAGVVIAIIAGAAAASVAAYAPNITLALVVLGLIVGFLNISEKETTPFLVAAIALIVAGTAVFTPLDQIVLGLGSIINGIVMNIAVFVTPAAILVALKGIWSMAKK